MSGNSSSNVREGRACRDTIGSRLPLAVLVSYALPAFVVALPTIPIYIHLPSLYGIELGLGLAVTGTVLLLSRLFDTVTDPVIGALSDRFTFAGNHRKPWIACGAVVAGLGLYKILNPPEAITVTYLLSWSLVLYAGWTMFAVPYTAWGAELSPDYDERTRITSWREGFGLVGIVGTGALVAALTNSGWREMDAIGAVAWAAIIMGAAAVPLLLWKVPDRGLRRPGGDFSFGFDRQQLWHVLTCNKPFLRLLTAWFLNGLANGIPAALFFIYLEHALGAGSETRTIFVLVYFVAAIAAIPLWLRLSRLFGKHRVWCWSMLAACAAFAAVPLLAEGAFLAFGVVCLITGMALGADLALPPAIQADGVAYHAWRFGKARAGLQFALWGMGTKLALAAAVGGALFGVDAFGFDPEAPSAEGRRALVLIYALVPVFVKATAIAVVWHFPLTAARQAAIRGRLIRRHRVAMETATESA